MSDPRALSDYAPWRRTRVVERLAEAMLRLEQLAAEGRLHHIDPPGTFTVREWVIWGDAYNGVPQCLGRGATLADAVAAVKNERRVPSWGPEEHRGHQD